MFELMGIINNKNNKCMEQEIITAKQTEDYVIPVATERALEGLVEIEKNALVLIWDYYNKHKTTKIVLPVSKIQMNEYEIQFFVYSLNNKPYDMRKVILDAKEENGNLVMDLNPQVLDELYDTSEGFVTHTCDFSRII